MDLIPRLGAIGAPTLVIAGRHDPATPPEHGERIAAGIPARASSSSTPRTSRPSSSRTP
jgi:pimeloyl-ACP methyl ester carboxylesterase